MQQVIDVLEAERDELRSGLPGLRSRSWSSASSTAGDVAKALDLERTVTGTRLVRMAESGELKMAARRYKAA